MSRTVTEVLRHYNELRDIGPNSELFHIRQDIDRALENAPLTNEERDILNTLYLSEPAQPVRTTGSGRPRSTHAEELLNLDDDRSDNAKAIYVSRRVKSAIDKLAEYLGDDYKETKTA